MIYKILVGNEHGGAAESSLEIINSFIDSEKFTVVFLCNGIFAGKFGNSNKKIIQLNSYAPPILASDNVFKRILNHLNFLFWIVYTLIKLVSFFKKKSVKFVHTTNNHALLIVLLAKYFYNPLFVISHWRCIGLASASKYQKILHKIDLIICISNAVKFSLPLYMQSKSEIIHDGINVKLINEEGIKAKGRLRKDLGFLPDDFVVGTIGSFTPIKGHKLLIEAVSKITDNNLKLVLFGSCPNNESLKYLANLKELVVKLGLKDKAYFLMNEQYTIPRNFIADLDIFIGPTWNNGLGEGFGLIYTEAMAQRLPVAAINVGAANEIIIDKETGFLIKNNNPDELATIIKYGINNRNELCELGERGFNRVIEKFDISSTIAKIRIIYSEKCDF